jgi:hypothetical protein
VGDVGAGDHAVASDVVGAARTGAHDAKQQRLTDVVFVDELHRDIGHQGGEREPKRRQGGGKSSSDRAHWLRQEPLRADCVWSEDDRWTQHVQLEVGVVR